MEDSRKIQKNGLVKATSLPPALVALKVMACREAYHHGNKKIINHEGRLLADLSMQSIGETFHIPTFDLMEETK